MIPIRRRTSRRYRTMPHTSPTPAPHTKHKTFATHLENSRRNSTFHFATSASKSATSRSAAARVWLHAPSQASTWRIVCADAGEVFCLISIHGEQTTSV